MVHGRVWVRSIASALVLIVVIAGWLWIERAAIVARVAAAQFDSRRVRARYVLSEVGFKTQRLENVVIGDPAQPDLTARSIEIDLALGLSGVSVTAVRAHGVRLRAALVGGKLRLGDVDRLLPAADGKPFALPDVPVAVDDAQVRLASPWGVIGFGFAGSGNPARRFAGQLAAASAPTRLGACEIAAPRARIAVTTRARIIRLTGPVTATGLRCAGGLRVADVAITPDISLPETLSRIDGQVYAQTGAIDVAGYRIRPGRFGGKTLAFATSGSATVNGTPGAVTGSATVRIDSVASALGTASDNRLVMAYRLSDGGQRVVISDGRYRARAVTLDRSLLAGVDGLVAQASATPMAAIARQLATALRGVSRERTVDMRFAATGASTEGSVSLSDVRIAGPDSTLISLTGEGLSLNFPQGTASIDGRVTLRSARGGLPTIDAQLSGDHLALSGQARVAPMTAGDARLALTPIRFGYRNQRWSLATAATLSGPFEGGRIDQLRVPLAIADNRLRLGCVPIAFDRLAVSSLTIGRTALALCVDGNAARLGAAQLVGTLGDAPLTLRAAATRFDIATRQFALSQVSASVGSGETFSRVALGTLSGSALSGSDIRGQFADAAGRIGGVPIDISKARGAWRFAQGALSLTAALHIADASPELRYFPLTSADFALTLSDQVITAGGTLADDESGARVARVAIGHDLRTAQGHADLTVDQLSFGRDLQPEALTPITFGVVANVVGTVSGAGRIDWRGDTVSSRGQFRTAGLDFAAAFGPVTQLNGEIILSDLLGLQTAPGQSVSIGSINPGIAVVDGIVRYQLLPGQQLAVEGGRWPFSGGELILEPAVLDLSEEATRRLTFRVEGLDAARFINQLDFDNIAATGVFDGSLPMIFDSSGGRIVGGRLMARGGGTLSYVGEVSNESLGLYGQFAFDALKSMRYDRLAIDLGGSLDGDIVTSVKFAGVNQAPLGAPRTRLPIRIIGLSNLPFIFNVTITAPFRQLFEASQSLQDPSGLIARELPRLQAREAPDATVPVQPKESDAVP